MEATLGGLPESFRMEADYQKDQAITRSLELCIQPPIFWEKERDWKQLIISHAYMLLPP